MHTQTAPDRTELLSFLQQASSYAHHPELVELKETHISWVFLADQFVFKLKKPVRFDFLDFSTCDLRKSACDAEVRLNRRLSPSVYLGVVPVRRSRTGELSVDGEGDVVDWLVKMRRLDDDRTLHSVLTDENKLASTKPTQIQSIAAHLAKFYAAQAPVTVRTQDFRDHIRHHIGDNEIQLSRILAAEDNPAERDRVELVHSSQKRFLVTHQDYFDSRVLDGRIVDGHGDLRPEHIYLYHDPLVIDCIEFNDEYRQNDIVDELAFLAMECDRLGEPSVGPRLFDAYTAVSNDRPHDKLIAFYKAYRACVRAKVAALRSQQQVSRAADASVRVEQAYLNLAAEYTRDLGPRLLLLVGGLMGTGKSTLANQLGSLLAAHVISSDVVRQENGQTPSNGASPPSFGAGKYSDESRKETYLRLLTAAADTFARNNAVILDATFSHQEMRQLAVELASQTDAQLIQVECECPREEALRRIRDRLAAGESHSEARPEYYDQQTEEAEPPLTELPLVRVDTTMALAHQEQTVLELVRDMIR